MMEVLQRLPMIKSLAKIRASFSTYQTKKCANNPTVVFFVNIMQTRTLVIKMYLPPHGNMDTSPNQSYPIEEHFKQWGGIYRKLCWQHQVSV